MSAFSVRGRLLVGTDLEPGALIVEGSRISEVLREPIVEALPQPVIEAPIVAPGYIDLQVNGGFGRDVAEGVESICHIARRLPEAGVTSWLPTIISSPPDVYRRAYRDFEQARSAPGARPLGFHLEGPYLSPRRKGAHPLDAIEGAEDSLLDVLLEGEALKLMTLAPERPGALERIRRLRERDVVVSLGHMDATYEDAVRGIDAGATMATHLYNAMSPFGHREPNAIGAALADRRVTAGLIVDGVHSHPAAVRLAVAAKGPGGIVLVTDMMAAAGMGPGSYRLGSQTVVVDGSAARLQDGTLAGAILSLDQAVRNVVAWTDTTPAQAIRMVTEVPARLLGLPHTGRIAAGCDADLALLDDDLRVQTTIVRGQRVFMAAAA